MVLQPLSKCSVQFAPRSVSLLFWGDHGYIEFVGSYSTEVPTGSSRGIYSSQAENGDTELILRPSCRLVRIAVLFIFGLF
jgi:hypothetical protein